MTSSTPRYDTIVVGSRASGAATAMLLARRGQRVLVVDRSQFGADTLSTHALMRGAVLQLHRWGLLERIIAAGTPPIRRTTFDYGTDRVEIDVKPAHGVDALYAPRRTVLDPVLVDAAAHAGAEIRFGVSVHDVRRDRQGRVAGVTGRDRAGRPFAADATVAELDQRVLDGWRVRATPFTDAFDRKEYLRVHPRAMPLAVVRNGRVSWLEAGHDPKVGAGGLLVALTPPRPPSG